MLVFELRFGAWKKGVCSAGGTREVLADLVYFFLSLLCVLDASAGNGEPFLIFLTWKCLHYGCGDRAFPGFFFSLLCFAFFSAGLVCAGVWWFSFTLAITA